MISVLIPAYNHPVAELVAALHQQCQQLGTFEILVADDASEQPYEEDYRRVSQLAGVRVIRQARNLGRARIRNLLAQEAQYDLLLFIDGDAEMICGDFISRYLRAAEAAPVVCGGTAYQPQKPAYPQQRLRWKYGRMREMRSSTERNQRPYQSFSSFNFLISREIFQQIQFNETIHQYGHEDTLLGIELSLRCVPIVHIDAPLLQSRLDTNTAFVGKTEQAVQNLWMLFQRDDLRRELLSSSPLISAFLCLKKLRLAGVFAVLFMLIQRVLRWLILRSSSLRLLDVYKLGLLCRLPHGSKSSI